MFEKKHILTKENLQLLGVYDKVHKLYMNVREEIIDRPYNYKNINANDVKNSIENFLKENSHLFSSNIRSCIQPLDKERSKV